MLVQQEKKQVDRSRDFRDGKKQCAVLAPHASSEGLSLIPFIYLSKMLRRQRTSQGLKVLTLLERAMQANITVKLSSLCAGVVGGDLSNRNSP